MDIMPVNLQMMYPASNEASQMHQNMNHAVAHQEDFETMKQKKEDELKQQQVKNKDNPEGGKIKDDPERQSRNGVYQRNARQRHQDDDEPKEKFAIDPMRGRHLDISL